MLLNNYLLTYLLDYQVISERREAGVRAPTYRDPKYAAVCSDSCRDGELAATFAVFAA